MTNCTSCGSRNLSDAEQRPKISAQDCDYLGLSYSDERVQAYNAAASAADSALCLDCGAVNEVASKEAAIGVGTHGYRVRFAYRCLECDAKHKTLEDLLEHVRTEHVVAG